MKQMPGNIKAEEVGENSTWTMIGCLETSTETFR